MSVIVPVRRSSGYSPFAGVDFSSACVEHTKRRKAAISVDGSGGRGDIIWEDTKEVSAAELDEPASGVASGSSPRKALQIGTREFWMRLTNNSQRSMSLTLRNGSLYRG